ncbi:MAG: sulfite exporter TauE/SafE family protein [Balneolaceae bacterium]|nr:sulfite exporter TauE/SafE family protein [Balneolaceae bacterium]
MRIIPRPLGFFLVLAFLLVVLWAFYMTWSQSWYLFQDNWFMTVTMIFGSFIAGASSEGGGAIAYPAMTLLFDIGPDVARNFSFVIQSFGMTFATIWIIMSKIKIESRYLLLAGLGGLLGIVAGSLFVAPFVPPGYAKMMFVSFWLSFGLALWIVTFVRKKKTRDQLPSLTGYQKLEIVLIGLIGGIFSSIFGNGLDICTFSYIVLKYDLSVKVATPTSVILMASNAIVGAILHVFILNTMQPEAISYFLVCLPVVIFGAPFGAYVVSKIGKETIAALLIFIIITQFITALAIIQPDSTLLFFSLGVFLIGILIFFLLPGSKISISQ